VLLHEIFIPILEMKTSTLKQKAVILSMLQRLCQDPQALVELYLNYDCDSEAVDNIYEQYVVVHWFIDCILIVFRCSLINIVSKLGTSPITHAPPKANDPTSPGLPPTTKGHTNSVPPTLSTTALSVPGSLDTSGLGHTESQLRRQSLECLVAVLRSLVAWGTTNSGSVNTASLDGGNSIATKSVTDDLRASTVTPDSSLDKLSGASATESIPIPDQFTDDPTKFESAKQKKTTLLEGIKKFNYKPKRVCVILGTTCFDR
jgi:brefeldin A-inhibited guanine nucleotide-exchange protein